MTLRFQILLEGEIVPEDGDIPLSLQAMLKEAVAEKLVSGLIDRDGNNCTLEVAVFTDEDDEEG